MQTFLPYQSFEKSAKALDMRRLGKQRVENLQIMKALVLGTGWIHHPAVKMWKGAEGTLYNYHLAICNEWTSRGYKDTCLVKQANIVLDNDVRHTAYPDWLGDEDFHTSHQSNLIRKDPSFYIPIFGDIPPDLPYVWPTHVVGL